MGNEITTLNLLLGGAIMMGHFVAGLFFLRFWKQTRDRLFAMFAAAFWLLSVNYLLLTPVLQQPDESVPRHYLVRFLAFMIILFGILDKNYSKRKR